ncbi:MAG: WG repeat-containing protein [Bacteroidales bacterium]|nr:WG repeat-containing protein [Bacteroidales bacterium]
MKKTVIIFIVILISFCSCFKRQEKQFSYDLIPVEINGKWGFIDQKGTFVINPQFNLAYLFSNELALTQDKRGKMGYIDVSGKYKIAPVYKYATNFSEGLAFVTPENNVPTCIDTTGKVIFQLYDADFVESFSEGMALFMSQGKYGFVNKKGEIAIPPQFESALQFSDGLAAVAVEVGQNFSVIKWGFIDKNGKFRVSPQFDEVHSFNEEKAFVKEHHNKKWGVIDTKGSLVILSQFDDATVFNENIAAIRLGDSWGFINEEGKIIVNPMFHAVLPYNGGIAAVYHEPLRWNFINKAGTFVFERHFQATSGFFGNHALIAQNNKIGLIDKKGEIVVKPQFNNTFSYYLPNEKLFLNEELFTFVYNDYFDAKLIADIFFMDMGTVSFRGLNERTTYETISERMEFGDLQEKSRYSVFCDDPIELVAGVASISSISFEFQTPIYKMEPEYYYGRQIGENKIFIPTAQLESVQFTLELNDDHAAAGKEKMFHDALLIALNERLSFLVWEEFPLENKTVATSERLRFTIKLEENGSIILAEFINPSYFTD